MGLCHRGGMRAWEKKKGDKDILSVEKGAVFGLERNSVSGHVFCHEEWKSTLVLGKLQMQKLGSTGLTRGCRWTLGQLKFTALLLRDSRFPSISEVQKVFEIGFLLSYSEWPEKNPMKQLAEKQLPPWKEEGFKERSLLEGTTRKKKKGSTMLFLPTFFVQLGSAGRWPRGGRSKHSLCYRQCL